jgi:hypothetical protein
VRFSRRRQGSHLHAGGQRNISVMSFTATAGILALALFGPTFPAPPPVMYDTVLSPDFTMDQAVAVFSAEASWLDVLPKELMFRTTISRDCDNADPRAIAGRLICVAPVNSWDMHTVMGRDGVAGVSWRSGLGRGAWNILLDTELLVASDDVQMIAAHEFGHAMGLDHNPKIHTLMFPSMTACNFLGLCSLAQARTPTPDDVRAWRHARTQ